MSVRSWASMPERGGWFAIRTAYAVIRSLGRAGRAAVVWSSACYYSLTSRAAVCASKEYLERLAQCSRLTARETPRPTFRNVIRHFASFGEAVVDKVRVWLGEITTDDIEITGRLEFREAIARRKKGAVLMTAHFGNVEIMRAAIDTLGDVPINALMYTVHAERFNSLMKRVNPRSQVNILSIESMGVDSVIDMQERVSRGECIAIMADRPSAGAADRSVRVPFLGKNAAFPEGPFLLASLLECPVYTVWCVKLPDGRFRAKITLFCEEMIIPRKERAKALAMWIRKYAEELEQQCLEAPFQWFNFFPFWRP